MRACAEQAGLTLYAFDRAQERLASFRIIEVIVNPCAGGDPLYGEYLDVVEASSSSFVAEFVGRVKVGEGEPLGVTLNIRIAVNTVV